MTGTTERGFVTIWCQFLNTLKYAMKKSDGCPCGSGQSYGDCCNRFLGTKTLPATAEQLMRSRYTAFVLEKAQYLYDTHHPQHRTDNELKNIKASFRGMQWLGLEIVSTRSGTAVDDTGIVEFIARFHHLGKLDLLHERSRFSKEQGQWLYQEGDVLSQL
jgi:SEC-C motif-containing protein